MTRSLWRERDFLLFWGGETVSTLGTSMSGIAFPLLILALTGSPALAGVAGALRAAPFALLGPVAGTLVALDPVKNVAMVAGTLPLIPEGLLARVVGGWDFLPAMTSSLGAALMGIGVQAVGVVGTVAAASTVMLLLALAATMNQQIRGAAAPSVD
jgi:hypothetical protein